MYIITTHPERKAVRPPEHSNDNKQTYQGITIHNEKTQAKRKTTTIRPSLEKAASPGLPATLNSI